MTTFLALGDSYTIGEGVDTAHTWPHLLAQACAWAAPEVIARTGWTADELLVALDEASPTGPFDIVSVLVGVNDQYRDREVAEHLPYFNRLLTRAVALADGDPQRVFVVSIPDWGATPFGHNDDRGPPAIAGSIDAYNAAQVELCALRAITHVDITPLTRRLAGDDAMLVGDRLHPSAAQYARWVELIAAAIAALR
ncbi:SGNH/GDSL hydrolase family protein [Pseudofulvimonas gallinarii]|jgi:lysophospholipase L1-like esterase|uniref:Lysophospholipase L1-like esterase n=1 Tax=Pseudofulvimonas gallinarii TaxID=634155 RepID=A0A4S3KTJ9_9GAMM|nr:GDSL-type esterase/lipase family protein [Pseudofulvimonas gallinarii]TCS94413.1 lysophospholipase L1-like esterase [Pseudofulvimonas gallinarii]THD12483.1 hypothetical protein B1808_12680 [Pseudofulvimonas gallinarii]